MEAKVFYASGRRGNEVRADGNGGLLARGWYSRVNGQRHGPFATEGKAKAAVADADRAFVERVEPQATEA